MKTRQEATDLPRIKVLWVTNILLPDVASKIGIPSTPFGGWLSLTTRALAEHDNSVEVGVAMRSPTRRFRKIESGGVSYFVLPQRRLDRFDVYQDDVRRTLTDFSPDLLHVEGTEMRHAYRFLNTWPGPRLVSLQGVLNGIAPYELGTLPLAKWLFLGPFRLRPVALAMLIRHYVQFIPRLRVEKKSLLRTTHVVGRTVWDEAQARLLNPNLRYHHVGRPLRDEFSARSWSNRDHTEFRLFFGNGAVPLKGLHFVLRAVAALRDEFPKIRLVVAGENPFALRLLSLKRHLGYPAYIRRLVRKLRLGESLEFCGVIPAEEVSAQMADSEVFVLGSLIENESATLGEAMMLGVPAVVSYAGGVPSMATDEEEVLFYRPEDTAMLAQQIRRLFTTPSLRVRLSNAAKRRARMSYDANSSVSRLISVYRSILS